MKKTKHPGGYPPRDLPAPATDHKGVAIEFLFWGFVAGLYVLWEVLFRYFGWLVENG